MSRSYNLNPKPTKSSFSLDYKAELNEEQYAAVSSQPGPALVIAGAGSGKTRTLTYRVAFLIEKGFEPKNILLLTFTNKASREMLERVKELVPVDISDLWGGTFHSICNRILRRHAGDIGFTSSFSILDRDDQKSLLNTVIADLDIDAKDKRFPKADVLLTIFSLSLNTGANIQAIVRESYPYFEDWVDQIEEINTKYVQKKKDVNSMDFDDLLVLTVKLLKGDLDLRQRYQKKFQHILVDEFQDTNHVQSSLVNLLVAGQESIMVVGDDAQSIYSWRGADMENILGFPERFKNARTFRIESNYRSVPEILELSNSAIKANSKQFEKNLKAHRQGGSARPALVALDDPAQQANFVAQRILELREEGVELEEIAVLYRAHHQSLEIQMELTNRDIPFQITSGLRFFEQAHIKDVAAFLRFVVNRKDEISFKRMVLMLPGVGNIGAEKLWRSWVATGWHERVENPAKFSSIMLEFRPPKKAATSWEQLCFTLDELIEGGEFARPSKMVYSVLEGVYDEYIRASFDNYEQRKQDIQQLMDYGEGFDDIMEFLAQLSLMSTVDDSPSGKKEQPDDESVVLSSIHQAKGLEWKAVFVIWLTEGMFPNGRILDMDDRDALEEERRLFYVALTRAKDELYLTYPMINPKSYRGDLVQTPSSFLNDFPRTLVEEWNVSNTPTWDEEDYLDEDFGDDPF